MEDDKINLGCVECDIIVGHNPLKTSHRRQKKIKDGEGRVDATTLSSCFLGVRSPRAFSFVATLCLAESSKLNPKRKPQSTAQGYGKAVSK